MVNQPMLASSQCLLPEDLDQIHYPKYVTDKLDGIRMLVGCQHSKCVGLSRRMKPIPNCHIQNWCDNDGIAGLDGEIMLGGPTTFHDVQSWVMTNYPISKDFTYYVFDHWWNGSDPLKGYLARLKILEQKVLRYGPPHVQILQPLQVNSPSELCAAFETAIKSGHEGLIVRSADGPYKQGRATFGEQYMLKMKAFADSEARIIGFVEAMKNDNDATLDERGYTTRTSHKANMKGKNTLGALKVQDIHSGEIFHVGSGMDDQLRLTIWLGKAIWLGEIITYKYQVHGIKEKPRCPIYKGVRRD